MRPSAAEPHEVLVLGGGVVGAATAHALARRGRRVLLLDQLEPGHRRGSSHGDGRIVRYTYPEAVYLEMARRAFRGWGEIEERTGERLIEVTGNWECGPEDSPQLADLVASFERDDLPYERLTAEESHRRFPHFRLPAGSIALHQGSGGVVRAGRAVELLWRLAREAGADVATGERIVEIDPGPPVRLRSAGGSEHRGQRLVVAAGGWSARLLAPLGLELPLTVTREVVAYFAPRAGTGVDHRVGAMPTLIDYHGERPFYGLPWIDVPGVKVGWHRSGPVVDPGPPTEEAEPEPDPDVLDRLRSYLAERLPHLDPEPTVTLTCLYTNTPDYHFVLDRHPELPHLAVGAGFSGHGFKFGPVTGEILADLALGEEPPVALELFRLARFQEGELRPRTGA